MTRNDTTQHAAGDQAERRQTPTERYHELALQAAQRQPIVPEHSLDLTRNAKGHVQIALTVRGADLAELERTATEAFARLCDLYPHPDEATPPAAASSRS